MDKEVAIHTEIKYMGMTQHCYQSSLKDMLRHLVHGHPEKDDNMVMFYFIKAIYKQITILYLQDAR